MYSADKGYFNNQAVCLWFDSIRVLVERLPFVAQLVEQPHKKSPFSIFLTSNFFANKKRG